MSDEHGPAVGPVMIYSARREDVAKFYTAIVGLPADETGEATWLEAANAQLVVHGPGAAQTPPEIQAQPGFVVWFGVGDVNAAHERAKKAGCLVGDFYGDYFFARDPDGRFIGIYASEDHHDHEH
jgi:predicted enzyme related to lactoylglutathione lyase